MVVLAAGRSQRMGSPKALLPFGTSTFLGTILENLAGIDFAWRAVVSSAELAPELPVPAIVNPDPKRGQISSLQTALRHGAGDHPWLMVVLVDLPAVRPETYAALVQATGQAGAIWVPSHAGRRGHPVIFSLDCYADLLQAGDAREVVAKHRLRRVEVEVDDPGILRDFDTPEDLKRWKTFTSYSDMFQQPDV